MLVASSSYRRRGAFALALSLSIVTAACAPAGSDSAGDSAGGDTGPMMIESQGSFMIGGKIDSDGKGNTIHCDNGFVDYQIPANARNTPIFLWHSSSAHVWQNRWDGGKGYQSILLERGYPVYMWDGPRVGRGNMPCTPNSYTPVMGQDQRNWVSWRFGPEAGQWFDGIQFPKDDKHAYDQAMSARYVEWDIAENAHMEASAAAKALDKIGPSVVLTNSAGDWRAMLAALETDNVKAIVAYEPAAFVFPEGEGPDGPETGFGPTHIPMKDFMRLTKIPIQIVWGDFTKGNYWEGTVEISKKFVDLVNANGGNAEILMLPDAGLKGNTHIPFADMNNVEVADQLALFLAKNGFDQR